MRRVYVYYRVNPVNDQAAVRTVDELFVRMLPLCEAAPYRLVRCDDPYTWMEIYEISADFSTFTRHLDAAVHLLDCDKFIEGERHQESFCDPDS
jgi:hypothetical protein